MGDKEKAMCGVTGERRKLYPKRDTQVTARSVFLPLITTVLLLATVPSWRIAEMPVSAKQILAS